jgi:predicted acetyltransferase
MSIELRAISQDEFIPFMTSLVSTFGGTPKPERLVVHQPYMEFDRTVAAFDGSRIVGTSGVESFKMTLPGFMTEPVGGVTMVTVSPTHRRQGILTGMMSKMFEDMDARGESLAILYASESVIYGRYGFGLGSLGVTLETDPRYSAFDRHPEITGTVDLITAEEASKVLPPLYERVYTQRPGCISRNGGWWDISFKDLEHWRNGYSNRRYAVYTSGKGKLDGYAMYRVKDDWIDDQFPNSHLSVTDFITATPEARAGLLQFCLNVDLVTKVTIDRTSIDDPLRWMMADPRRLRMKTVADALWVRLLDIPKALSSRRYSTEDCLVFEVDDPFRPDNSGRYVVEGGPDGATSRRVRSKPDLCLQVTDLGAAYLGGTPFSPLARAGRITERTKGALRRADLMFSSDPQPWCSTGF